MDHEGNTVSRWRRLPPKAAALALVVAASVNSGCDMPALPALPDIPGVYRLDVQQGNVIDQDMLDRIEIGMEPRKVRFILGTPLLVDPFNQNRWDYFYSLRSSTGPEVTQRVTLYFVDDQLARIENRLRSGAVPPSAAERTQTLVKVPKPQPSEGLLDRLTPDFLEGDDEPASESAPDAVQPASASEDSPAVTPDASSSE